MIYLTNIQALANCLGQLPPVELQAVTLLQEGRQRAATGDVLPTVPPDQIAAATVELIAYTKACATLVRNLAYLTPVILPDLECPTWAL